MKKYLSPKLQRLMELEDKPDPTAFWGSRDMYLVLGAVLLLAVLLFIWATYVRKRKRRRRSRYDLPSEISRGPRDRRRKKKRRWKNRNPTLSQTGGLPPAKDERPVSDSG